MVRTLHVKLYTKRETDSYDFGRVDRHLGAFHLGRYARGGLHFYIERAVGDGVLGIRWGACRRRCPEFEDSGSLRV